MTSSTICYRIECNDNDARFLIGRKGQTLESLQFLLRQMVKGGEPGEQEYFILDVRDYRSRRESALLDRAKRAAVGVLNGEYEQYDLPPMSAFERRIVHNYLHEHFPDLSSDSQGLGISRHIVISYKGLPAEGEEGAVAAEHEQEEVEASVDRGEEGNE